MSQGNQKICELKNYIAKCEEENTQRLNEKRAALDAALEEKCALKKSISELKERLDSVRSEHVANQNAYKKAMKELAEAERELQRLTCEINQLKSELKSLKSDLEEACQEYKKLHLEQCQIKDDMLKEEEARKNALNFFFEIESKVLALDAKIQQLTNEKNEFERLNEESRSLASNLSKQIQDKEDNIANLDHK